MENEPEQAMSSKRDESSLYTLARKFMRLINESPENHMNMSRVAELLGVGKRRIYDITNVLEGIGMVSKWSVNSVKWMGRSIDELLSSEPGDDLLAGAFEKKGDEERRVKEEIKELNDRIYELSKDAKNLKHAYVTYDDLQGLRTFRRKLVFALKAPNDTTIEYPRYYKGAYRLKIMAEKGPISVYYVTNE